MHVSVHDDRGLSHRKRRQQWQYQRVLTQLPMGIYYITYPTFAVIS